MMVFMVVSMVVSMVAVMVSAVISLLDTVVRFRDAVSNTGQYQHQSQHLKLNNNISDLTGSYVGTSKTRVYKLPAVRFSQKI